MMAKVQLEDMNIYYFHLGGITLYAFYDIWEKGVIVNIWWGNNIYEAHTEYVRGVFLKEHNLQLKLSFRRLIRVAYIRTKEYPSQSHSFIFSLTRFFKYHFPLTRIKAHSVYVENDKASCLDKKGRRMPGLTQIKYRENLSRIKKRCIKNYKTTFRKMPKPEPTTK